MKRMLVGLLLASIVLVPVEASDYFCKPKIIEKVYKHTCIVATYFDNLNGSYEVNFGAGVMIKDNYIITAAHVLEHHGMDIDNIFVIFPGMEDWVKCDLIAMGEPLPSHMDYGIIKTREPLSLPGLKIAKRPLKMLQKVLFCGTPDGMAFFMRGGYVSKLLFYINVDGQGALSFQSLFSFHNVVVQPGYGGDSGGVIANTKGEIQSIMYFGLRDRPYVFGNPVDILWEFLREHNLEGIGR
jgi:hypothetical protein